MRLTTLSTLGALGVLLAAAPALARVLLGESPAGIPMGNVSVNTIKFNRETIARYGFRIDDALIRELEASSTSPNSARGGND